MSVKSLLRKTPGVLALRNWAATELFTKFMDKNVVLKGFIDGNGWLFSQPKTGTNLIANTLAFYNADSLGIAGCTFEDRYKLGLIHGGRIIRDAAGITEALQFQRKSTRMLMTRWHDDVAGAQPEALVCTSRSVLDQFESMWNFKFKPAGVGVDAALPELAQMFARRNRDQRLAIGRSQRSVVVMYEDLIADPFAQMKRIIDCAYGTTDEQALRAALERSDRKSFQKWEAERGAPAISAELAKFEKSFIRSGKVGEGKSFFTDAQTAKIQALAEQGGFDLSGRVDAPLAMGARVGAP